MSAGDGGRRKKALFFAESVTLAHRARPAVLASMLDDTEFDVIIAADPRYSALFPGQQARTVDLYSISSGEFIAALAAGKPLYSAAVLERYVEDDLRIIDEYKPDIVIGDFRLSLSISARLRQVPYLAIANAYWSSYARQRYTIPEHPLTNLLGVPLAEALFRAVRPLVFSMHSLPLNRVRKKHGLQPLGLNLNRVYTDSDYLLYADLPSLVEMQELPANHHFLGPVLWSPEHSYPQWWDELDPSATTIYITLGSSGRGDLLPMIIESLRHLPAQLLVSTAGQTDMNISAPGVFASEYLPGEAAAAKSDLVICNGGSLTTYQAFSQGVPVLGIAGNLDQHLNMIAVVERGAGMRLRTDKLSAHTSRQAVEQLLRESSFAREAKVLQAQMGQADVRSRFLEYLRAIG